jgi:hypothetical protein
MSLVLESGSQMATTHRHTEVLMSLSTFARPDRSGYRVVKAKV